MCSMYYRLDGGLEKSIVRECRVNNISVLGLLLILCGAIYFF